MSELRPGGRVGQDAAGIIIDVRGNKSGSDYGKKQQDPDLPTFQQTHARISQTYEWNRLQRRNRINAGSDLTKRKVRRA
jgi:hypothetical protein